MILNVRAVSHILTGMDEKAKAIREILDFFLPSFKNLSKDTPILIDLPEKLSPTVAGTGVSILTDLYYEIEINPQVYTSNKVQCVTKSILRDFDRFLLSSPIVTKKQIKTMHIYKMQLEVASKFTDITPEMFIACVIVHVFKRSGMIDFDLFNKADAYYNHCMEVMELLLKNININNSVVANPVFGCLEHRIAADGDFILDGNLYDIKTTKSIAVNKNSRRQLLFYYLLNHIKSDSQPYEKIPKPYKTQYNISKLYIYKARYGISIEIPFNLRGVNPLEVMNTITKVETGKISPTEGIELVKSMLKEELEPKRESLKPTKSSTKKIKTKPPKEIKPYKFKLKRVFLCNETNEVFDRVAEANEKYGFSKNVIYKCLEGRLKHSNTKCGKKLTWRSIYRIV